jgi:hypothetical protein
MVFSRSLKLLIRLIITIESVEKTKTRTARLLKIMHGNKIAKFKRSILIKFK